MLKKNKGMTILETSVLIFAIGTALSVMLVYLQRGIQGRVKDTVDQLGPQFDVNGSSYREITTTENSTTNVTSSAPANGTVTTNTSEVSDLTEETSGWDNL